MRKFTLLMMSLLLTVGAMAQKAHQRVSHEGWVVTALNEAGVYGNEGGVAFIADDNPATFYHSNWSSNYDDGNGVNKGKDGLQAFMVELPASLDELSLITYKGRSDNNGSGWARGVRVYVFETLPQGWPAKGLSSLGYTDKEALLSKDNANLGTAAFDNTGKLWENNQNQKMVEFATPQTGKYVLFIMESGSDNWLTCSDFQIYQYKDYTAIKEDNPYYLQVTNAKAEGTLFVDTKTANSDTSGPTIGVSETAVETYFDWNENGWFIKNTEGKYIGVSKWCAGPQNTDGYEWQLLVNDDNTVSLLQSTYDGNSDNSRCFLGGDVTTNESVVKLFTDNPKGKAINVKLIDASAVPVTVKYVFTWNGVEKGTQTTETFSGELYPDVNFGLPYGVVAEKPTGEIDAKEAEEVEGVKTITKTIVLKSKLPFVYADEYANINNWYYLQFNANTKNYLYYDGTANVLDASKTAVDASQRDNYTWGFIGDPFTGFTVVNRSAGESKALNAGKDGAIVGDEAQVLTLTASSHGENGFFMQNLSGDYTERFNKQSNKVVYWSGADAGSTFMVVERDMTGAAELQVLIDAVDAVSASYQGAIGTAVGNLTEESVTTVTNALATAKSILALDDRTPEQISEAHLALQAAIDGLVTVQPEEGAFYYISSAMPSSDGRSGQKMYVNNDGAMQFQNAATLANVFQFVPAGDNTFYLYNVERGTYLNSNKGHAGGQATAVATTGTVKVAIANMGREKAVSIIPNGGAMLHAQAAGSQVVAWNNTDNAGASAWVISEVADITALSHELTVGEAGYATLCLGYNATIPAIEGEECGVYTAAVNGDWATLTEVEGVLPANTAVIVKATAGTYNFNYATGEVSAIKNNELKGTTINKNFTEEAYVLGVVEGEVGLYKAAYNVSTDTTNDGTAEEPAVTYEAWKNNAFKAYLPMPAAGSGISFYGFRFGGEDDETTGVEKVEVATENAVIFDLAGRRVSEITAPGIYIVNGKKVIK